MGMAARVRLLKGRVGHVESDVQFESDTMSEQRVSSNYRGVEASEGTDIQLGQQTDFDDRHRCSKRGNIGYIRGGGVSVVKWQQKT
ncbi:hypothetical protein GCM10009104_36080 [Marinobacterium maritimum]|uniref:Uncharacterized protein n=1 Tax=Marinobacterium maritimum TaxID=500162 RepID=A0ABP3THC0_9GAMM